MEGQLPTFYALSKALSPFFLIPQPLPPGLDIERTGEKLRILDLEEKLLQLKWLKERFSEKGKELNDLCTLSGLLGWASSDGFGSLTGIQKIIGHNVKPDELSALSKCLEMMELGHKLRLTFFLYDQTLRELFFRSLNPVFGCYATTQIKVGVEEEATWKKIQSLLPALPLLVTYPKNLEDLTGDLLERNKLMKLLITADMPMIRDQLKALDVNGVLETPNINENGWFLPASEQGFSEMMKNKNNTRRIDSCLAFLSFFQLVAEMAGFLKCMIKMKVEDEGKSNASDPALSSPASSSSAAVATDKTTKRKGKFSVKNGGKSNEPLAQSISGKKGVKKRTFSFITVNKYTDHIITSPSPIPEEHPSSISTLSSNSSSSSESQESMVSSPLSFVDCDPSLPSPRKNSANHNGNKARDNGGGGGGRKGTKAGRNRQGSVEPVNQQQQQQQQSDPSSIAEYCLTQLGKMVCRFFEKSAQLPGASCLMSNLTAPWEDIREDFLSLAFHNLCVPEAMEDENEWQQASADFKAYTQKCITQSRIVLRSFFWRSQTFRDINRQVEEEGKPMEHDFAYKASQEYHNTLQGAFLLSMKNQISCEPVELIPTDMAALAQEIMGTTESMQEIDRHRLISLALINRLIQKIIIFFRELKELLENNPIVRIGPYKQVLRKQPKPGKPCHNDFIPEPQPPKTLNRKTSKLLNTFLSPQYNDISFCEEEEEVDEPYDPKVLDNTFLNQSHRNIKQEEFGDQMHPLLSQHTMSNHNNHPGAAVGFGPEYSPSDGDDDDYEVELDTGMVLAGDTMHEGGSSFFFQSDIYATLPPQHQLDRKRVNPFYEDQYRKK